MRIMLVLGHPAPGSLNHALAQRVRRTLEDLGHRVFYHDLCAEGFDPLLSASEFPRGVILGPVIDLHCAELAEADGIVIVHPNWWGMPPAVLKGWIDRVFRPGVAYEFLPGDGGEGVPRGLLKARRALVLNTSNTYPEREAAVFGDPLERIWKDCVFGLCGVTEVTRRSFGVVAASTPAERAVWLSEAARLAAELFPVE